MLKVGIVGWRGMVGSVLMDRMRQENDFTEFTPVFASTSQAGQSSPNVGMGTHPMIDAYDIAALAALDIIVTCQGGDYSKEIYPKIVEAGFSGYWIDAASAFRMDSDAVIVLDPVNRGVIDEALASGTKKFIGGNCTVSLMLMAMNGLFQEGLVEWMTTMTYQSASGAGAQNMRELVAQMGAISEQTSSLWKQKNAPILELDQAVGAAMAAPSFPMEAFGFPLAGSALPWIDRAMENGQSREEWKGAAETNKILGTQTVIPVDGICVRIGALRCHSQAMTMKLKKDVPLETLVGLIAKGNDWVRVIPNTKEESLAKLTPAAVAGKLEVPVGRLRKLNIGPEYLTGFTVGDQLLWGAAEPIRRMLRLVIDYTQQPRR